MRGRILLFVLLLAALFPAASVDVSVQSGIGVGVTVIRALENNVTPSKKVTPADTWTDKFIFPPYEFSIPDAIVSNFHMPESTMLMCVAAFGGFENVMHAYEVALQEGYRFGPYGDAMLII